MSSVLRLQDAFIIAKTFEHGCSASISEESVFALLTPQLRTASCFVSNVSLLEGNDLDTTRADGTPSISLSDDKGSIDSQDEGADENTASLLDKFLKQCVPCLDKALRAIAKGELAKDLFDFKGSLIKDLRLTALQQLLDQVNAIIQMFASIQTEAMDLCPLFNLLNGMCGPDLYRILVALIAFLAILSLEINGALDFLIGLVLPLMLSFVQSFVDVLMKYLMILVRPLECIMDEIQRILNKLDYNVLFEQIGSIQNIGFGPKSEQNSSTPGVTSGSATVSALHVSVPGAPQTQRAFEWNFTQVPGLPSAKDIIIADNKKRQAAVEAAASEIEALNNAARNVDMTDPQAVQEHKEKTSTAVNRYTDAVADRDLSVIGKASQGIDKFRTKFKSLIGMLMSVLTTVKEYIEDLITNFIQELQKLLGQFLSIGEGSFISNLLEKLKIVQLINFVKAVIELKNFDPSQCDPTNEPATIALMTSGLSTPLNISTDENGNTTVEIADDELDNVLNEVLGNLSNLGNGSPNSNDGNLGNQGNTEQDLLNNPDTANVNLVPGAGLTNGSGDKTTKFNNNQMSDNTRDNFRKAIKFTGNPAIDSEISRTVEGLLNPGKVKFKCTSVTTVSQAEKLNKWIAELSSQGV